MCRKTRSPLFRNLLIRSLFLSSFIVISSSYAFAQEQGNNIYISLKNNKYLSIQPCNNQIFRVRISDNKDFPESLMERYDIVKTNWRKIKFSTKTTKDKEIITTKGYQVFIDKKTGELTIKNSLGKTVIRNISFFDEDNSVVARLKTSLNNKFEKTKTGKGIIGDTNYSEAKKNGENIVQSTGNSIISVSLEKGERFYGGGSTSRDNIQHRGEVLRMWATYQIAEVPVPFLMSSNGWGLFNNTTLLNFFDIGRFDKDKLFVFNTNNDIDFYIMLGESMKDVLAQYTTITRKPYILPKWMYGLAFGGNMMEDQMDMMNDAVRFRDEKIPCDIFWIEPQWMAKYYDFSTSKTWNQAKFPGEPYWEVEMDNKKREHPHLFIHKLHQLGYKLGLWLCIDHDFTIAEEDELAKKDGKEISGQEHWFDHLTKFIDEGVDGFKLDPGRTLDEHPDRKYYNGYSDNEMHNLNQILIQKQMEKTFRRHKGIRSFHHYCGGYAGAQHWGALTSGDNGGGKIALFDQLNLGLSGFMNTSADVLEVSADKTLQAMHMGFFLPWVQVNSWYGLLHPWYFSPVEKNAFRFYSQLRHDLIPYIYSEAINGNLTGEPIVRAMALEFPDDRNCDNLIYQYMFGENLLIGIGSDSIYLPKGNWINFWSGNKTGGGGTIHAKFPKNRGGQLFVKSGAIIPYQKSKQYITLNFPDTLIVRIYPEDKSSYTLFEDDGISYNYEQGDIAKTLFNCVNSEDEISFTVTVEPAGYIEQLKNRNYQFEFFCKQPQKILFNGSLVDSNDWNYDFENKKLEVSVNMNGVETVNLVIKK